MEGYIGITQIQVRLISHLNYLINHLFNIYLIKHLEYLLITKIYLLTAYLT
jgi:hypothetical protein